MIAKDFSTVGSSEAPVLVTGAAGYIGSMLVRRLLNRGYHVRVLDRLMYGDEAIRAILSHPRLEMVVADFRDRIVGDPACAIDEDFTIATNFEATRTIAEAAKRAGVRRFIFGSTCSVYGASDERLDESSALNPVSLYANTKIAAERALLALADASFAPVVMRFATAYGHSYRPRYDLAVNVMTAKAVTEGQITIHGGDQWRPFVHVDDIARALILALEAPVGAVAGETFNVGSDTQNHQLKEVGDIIRQLIPNAAVLTNDLVVDKRNYYVRFEKIRKTLGFAPIHTLAESIVEMKEALESGDVRDYRDRRYNNHQYLSQIVAAVAPQPRSFVADRRIAARAVGDLMLAAGGD
jgi:nucleoside-diphosphate-sugar epimerase